VCVCARAYIFQVEFFCDVKQFGVVVGYQYFWCPCGLNLHVVPCSVVVGYQHFTGTCCFHPEDGGNIDLWNFGILPQLYMASQPKRTWLETSSPWKPQNNSLSLHVIIFLLNPSYVFSPAFLHFLNYKDPRYVISLIISRIRRLGV